MKDLSSPGVWDTPENVSDCSNHLANTDQQLQAMLCASRGDTALRATWIWWEDGRKIK